MRRRAWLLGGAAAVGALGGAGVAIVRQGSDPAANDARAAAELWSLSFERLDGTALAMRSLRGKPLLLNFWATWCAPCVTELPLLDAFSREHAERWQVLGLAVDRPDPVRRFAAERALQLPLALAGMEGIELSRSLGNAAAALPFTVVFDSRGRLVQRRLGVLDAEMLREWSRITAASGAN
ncbi:MAG TPA: TlpA disulfide reductase family protein [Caldimonas sp.]|jgi:thiol-disulfide isomerase/thioredoxin|nr:TlpA disulfide reductase family protein [Caldimonas sp.]HEX2540874.1 TlpA disulfide reductase family protein [Caldimonas sp.]